MNSMECTAKTVVDLMNECFRLNTMMSYAVVR
jgi:hypothetical protein